MAVKTTAQLCERVAQILNQTRPGQAISARSRDTISGVYGNVLPELYDLGAAYWAADEIPLAAFERLAMLVAVDVAPAFGALPIVLSSLGLSNALEAREFCIGKLRLHSEREPDYETVHTLSDWM